MTAKFATSYVKGTGCLSDLQYRTVPELLRHHATVRPDKTAFVFLTTELARETVTWKELFNKSVKIAKSLVELGVKQGEIAAVSFRVCPEWLFVHFGMIMAGVIPVGVPFASPDGSDVMLMMSRLKTCAAIFLDPGPDNYAWKILRSLVDDFDEKGNLKSSKMPTLRYLACLSDLEGVLTLDKLGDLANEDTKLPDVSEDDVIALFQTSGSTGIPKIIAHTHKSLSHCVSFFKLVGLTGDDDDIIYNGRPFSWMGGYPMNIYNGETRVTRSGMSAIPEKMTDFVYSAIRQEKVTFIFTLPSFIAELMQKEIPADWSVRTINTGGQPITKQYARCINMGLTKNFCVLYVSTEATMVLYNMVNKTEDFIEYSCGRPFPGVEVKVVNDDGVTVPPYQRGEIHIRSEGMFKYYYNEMEKTRSVLSEEGWNATGDLGYMTEDGIFYVEGRKFDMIISRGFGVAPFILENVMKNMLGVKDAMVVPIPDEQNQQDICACFVTNTGSDVIEEDVRQYVENVKADSPRLFTVLPRYYLKFVTFPETDTGKTSRKLLKAEATSRIHK